MSRGLHVRYFELTELPLIPQDELQKEAEAQGLLNALKLRTMVKL